MSVAALSDIKILDLTRLLPGPFASLMLADLGASVVKVEQPGEGDYNRHYKAAIGGVGASFLMLNRNKKSITINLKHPKGVDIFKQLAAQADVVIEGFRPGVMKRLGVGWDDLKAVNERLIYCAITGYGQDGPYSMYPGHDINYLGYAGALEVTGPRGGKPLMPGVQVADIGGGALYAAFSIMAAIHARSNTGKGQFLDVSMTDGVVAWMAVNYSALRATGGEVPTRGEMRLNGGVPCYGIYECSDGKYVTLGALEEKFWKNFCEKVGKPHLLEHSRAEGDKRDEVEKELVEMFKSKTSREWLDLLEKEDICFGPVNTVADAVRDPQIASRRMFFTMEQAQAGKIPQVAFPVRFSDTPFSPRTPPPRLGEHNKMIYSSLGLDVDELKKEGVI